MVDGMREARRRSRTVIPVVLLLLVVALPVHAGSVRHHDGDIGSELSISRPDAVRAPVQGPRQLPALLLASAAAVLAAMVLGAERFARSTNDRGTGPLRVGSGGLARRGPPVG